MAFVPEPLPNAGDILIGSWPNGPIDIHTLSANPDGTFSPELDGFYSSLPEGATADLHFIPTGDFANDLAFTNWVKEEVSIMHIDPATGLPQPGAMTLLVSDLGKGPWGLDFDPVTGNLFIANFHGEPSNGLVQIAGFSFPVMDGDGDGVADDQDQCPGGDDNVDSDGDLVPDFCDDCPLHAEDDPDGDGVCGSPLVLSCEGFEGIDYSLEAELLDEGGVMVTDTDITAPLAKVLFFSVDGADPVDLSSEIAPDDFAFTDKMWRTLLAEDQMLAPGTYAVTMESSDDLEYIINPTCSVWIMQELPPEPLDDPIDYTLDDPLDDGSIHDGSIHDHPKCSKKRSKKASKKKRKASKKHKHKASRKGCR
jgi:hypothetical protein